MKRSVRDIGLMCAPIVVAAGAFFVFRRVLHPQRDPNAKIVLTLGRDATYSNVANQGVLFPWKAQASDGTSFPIGLVYAERLVASGHGNTQAIYGDPPPVASSLRTPFPPIGVATLTNYTRDSVSYGKVITVFPATLPIWTQRLEWQGDVVAVPVANAVSATAATSATLHQWAQKPGAVRVAKTLSVTFKSQDVSPILRCELEPVNAQNRGLGADTCITVEWRDTKREVFRRLVAFDGKTRRILWSDNSDYRNPYWKSEESQDALGRDTNWLLFRLRDVPISWGKITFFVDEARPHATQRRSKNSSRRAGSSSRASSRCANKSQKNRRKPLHLQ